MVEIIELSSWSGGTRASVVFVHGISGHAYDTWRRGVGNASQDPSFWPYWLANDFHGGSIFTIAYEAPTSRWIGTSMPLEDWADNVAESLVTHRQFQSGPIAFICHSLGGLIIKRALLTLWEQKDQRSEAADFLKRVRLVIFAATPHTGSRQATLLGKLSVLVWPTPLAAVLFSNSPTLRQINISYRTLAKNYNETLSHRVFFETLDTVTFRIVTEEAADPGLDTRPLGIAANHIDIVKPSGQSADVYTQTMYSLEAVVNKVDNYGELRLHRLSAVGSHKSPYFWPRILRASMLCVVIALLILSISNYFKESRDRDTPSIPDPAKAHSVKEFKDALREIVVKKGHYTPQTISQISNDLTNSLLSNDSLVDRVRRRQLNEQIISTLRVLNDSDLSLPWRGRVIDNIDMSYLDLSGVNIRGVWFRKVFMLYTKFNGAQIDDAQFSISHLRFADFSGSNLSNVKFSDSDWYSAKGIVQIKGRPSLIDEWSSCPEISKNEERFANFISDADDLYYTTFRNLEDREQRDLRDLWNAYTEKDGLCSQISSQ
jgi:pimeloyl-ACP methyl ester carboxylesterase